MRFGPDKVLARPRGQAFGEPVEGYEIHLGRVVADGGEPFLDGCALGAVRGTSWHGTFENDAFRRAFLARVAAEAGRRFVPAPDVSFPALRERRLDTLGDLVADHLDTRRGAAAARDRSAGRAAVRPTGSAEMIVLLSTADTDLLAARAGGGLLAERAEATQYRTANPARIGADDVPALLDGAWCVVVRLLGGRRTWAEGLDAVLAAGLPTIVLGGEAAPDAALMALSTVPAGVAAETLAYLREGGPATSPSWPGSCPTRCC